MGAGIAEGCDRLLAGDVPECERAAQRRLTALLVIAPFMFGVAWMAIAAGSLTIATVFGAAVSVLALAWLAIVMMSTSRRLQPSALLALATGTAGASLLVAASGGLASPMLLVVLALPFEAWWVTRGRRPTVAGGLAALAAVLAQPLLAAALPLEGAAPAIWHWLAPLAYAATALPRFMEFLVERRAAKPEDRNEARDLLDAAVLRLDADGEVIDAGGRAAEMIGVPVGLLLGEGLFERIHVGDRVTFLRAISELRREGPSARFEIRVRVASDDAGARYRSFAAELHPGEERLLVLRDNSTVDAMRTEIAALREEVAKADVTKARFLATVSHELRTPLNAIIGFSDMLAFEMVGKFTDPRQKEYAGLIRDSGGHLLSVVNAILDISRIESRSYSIHSEPFAFAEAAAACHGMLAMQAKAKAVELHNMVMPGVGMLNADRRAVQQVLINLLSNAVKFTPSGGTVRLAARRTAASLVFEVSDNGIGIAEDDLERICRPFVQARNDYSREHDGVGLGLSIAKGLVALHGGSMSISSAPDAGTTVTVTLPLDGPQVSHRNGPDTVAEETGKEEHSDAPFRKSA